MEEKFEKNELFQASHLMILISYTIFSVILIGESILLSWENWALIIITLGLVISWGLHIQQKVSSYQRLWVYSVLMMGTFFFYGIHRTSMYDTAPVMTAVIMLYTMTGIKSLITLCQVSYYVTFGYDLVLLFYSGEKVDSLFLTRTLLHLALIFMVGWIARTIIDKWRQVLGRSKEEIEMLSEATTKMNDFLANMSHEIRTPVNAVIGLTGVCIEKEQNPEIKTALRDVKAAGRRVGEQISDILDYSEIDMDHLAVNTEDYMLSSVLNDLVMQVKELKQSELELIIDVDPALPQVMHTDVGKLKKILWHLIVNGLKYTKEGGVYVRIYSIKETYGINLCIQVTDTGIGMTESELERISDGFYQANSGRTRSTSGLGLGMSIVSGFVSALHGFMTIESSPENGTTVHVSIPQEVVDESECMSVRNREKLSLGAFLHFEKYENAYVRDFYNAMIRDMVLGLKVQMHKVDHVENLKKLLTGIKLTHLFVGEEEYSENVPYMEQLSKEMKVVVVAYDDFETRKGSRAKILRKPFYCFPVIGVLNADADSEEEAGRIFCPGVRALVVDDEPMNLIVANGIFKRYEMVVTTAASGEEAIRLCREQEYDIVFMDHMMPEMDGVEAMKRIRSEAGRRNRELPIVALTANAVSTAKEMFLSEGFDGFVSKPVDLVELERVLKKVLPKSAIELRSEEEEETQTETVAEKEEQNPYAPLKALGVNVERGLYYCQNEEDFYKELLMQFASDAAGKRTNAGIYYFGQDFPNYAIIVHALKSTAKMIGAEKLSEEAKNLEAAAKAGDGIFIQTNHEKVMKEYEKLSNGILALFESVEEFQPEEPENGWEEVLEFGPEEEVLEFDPEEEILEFVPEGGEGS